MRRAPWLLALDVALVAVVGAGITGFARSDKQVELSVDGDVQQVRTFTDDVGELLAEQDLEVSDRDVVAPGLDSPVVDGGLVSVRFARQLRVSVDGQTQQIWTTATTVDDALDDLGVRSGSAVLSASRSERLPLTGFNLGVQLPDEVTVLHDHRRTTVVTAAPTVAGALRDAGVRIREDDRLDVSIKAKLRQGMVITLTRVDTNHAKRSYVVNSKTIRRADRSMYEGTEDVVREGRDGRGVAAYRLVKHDGVVVSRELLSHEVVRQPVNRVISYGTKERPFAAPSTSASALNWGALAQCESGGSPTAVNSGGYYGLYQFTLSTWASVGGTGNPIYASATEQTYRAQVLYQRSGSSPWPVCGRLLFT